MSILLQYSPTLIPLAAIILALLALAGYVRLRRRGLVEATKWSWILAGLMVATAILLAIPGQHLTALGLALPALAIVWDWSGRVMPAKTHFGAWVGLAALLLVGQMVK